MEVLEICLFNNDSKFDQDHLQQTNSTAIVAPNSCSYFDLANYRLDKMINNERVHNFSELFRHGKYERYYRLQKTKRESFAFTVNFLS